MDTLEVVNSVEKFVRSISLVCLCLSLSLCGWDMHCIPVLPLAAALSCQEWISHMHKECMYHVIIVKGLMKAALLVKTVNG